MNETVSYNPKTDVLNIYMKRKYATRYELYPGIYVDVDSKGEPIAVQILNASSVFEEVIKHATRSNSGKNSK